MDPISIDGMTFLPVIALAKTSRRDGRQYEPVTINGRALYSVPGGLMAYADDLPRIAKLLNPPRRPSSNG